MRDRPRVVARAADEAEARGQRAGCVVESVDAPRGRKQHRPDERGGVASAMLGVLEKGLGESEGRGWEHRGVVEEAFEELA
ncbi:MAG: hypothetical protein EOO67_10145 [Microbacterium sp.]|nr:MAG: hypothetical protein EOO67_10145 [Microbacterium sp.]